MRIIHILQSSRFSGAENVVCQIIKMFENNSDCEMTYVCRSGEIDSVLEKLGVKQYKLEKFNVLEIRKAINELNPDIIHAHDISASVYSALASFGKKVKIVSHVHVNNANMKKINLKTVLYFVAARRFSHIFWVSQSCYDGYIFRNRLSIKSEILSNVVSKESVDFKKSWDSEEYNYDISYVGRLTDQKDPERLIRVLDSLAKINPSVKIAIVGTGELEQFTRDIVVKRKLENNITFHGFMKNPLKLLESSKVMIMTSKFEGLPMTVLEAFALGVPVVSTPVDGLINVVKSGDNGYLDDEDEKLVQHLHEIITDSYLHDRLSRGAVKTFSELNDVKSYKKCIQKVYSRIIE